MKRLLAIILVVVLLLGSLASVLSLFVFAAEAENVVYNGGSRVPEGSGTEEDPYLISCAEHLKWLSSLSKNGDQVLRSIAPNGQTWKPTYDSETERLYYNYSMTADKAENLKLLEAQLKTVDFSSFERAPQVYIRQVCDIDLNGKSITSIASYWYYPGVVNRSYIVKGQWFSGHYDGQGYAIRNGTFSSGGSGANWAGGLFGNLMGATVENIVFDNIKITGTGPMGFVAGRALAPTDLDGQSELFLGKKNVIRNIQVTDTCSMTMSNATETVSVGGIIGTAYNTTVENCTNAASIRVGIGGAWTGGIVGLMSFNTTVKNCVNTGNITCTGGKLLAENAYGGIVGSWQMTADGGAQGRSEISRCLNKGTMITSEISGGTVISYGGILGRAYNLTKTGISSYQFEENINMGVTPNFSSVLTSKARPAAACVGRVENNVIPFEAFVAENCYTVNTFTAGESNEHVLLPSANCPILYSTLYNSTAVAEAVNCQSLSAAAISALPLVKSLKNYRSYSGYVHPVLGAQTKQNADGTYNLRIIGGVDSLDYNLLSYTVRVTAQGKSEESLVTLNRVYTSFVDGGTTVTAEELGFSYLSFLTQEGLKKNTKYIIALTPNAYRNEDGSVYTLGGMPVIIQFYNGSLLFKEVDPTPEIMIDGVNIQNFSLVIPSSENTYEYYVAQELQEHIKRLTGTTLTIQNDVRPIGAHEIRIGKTNRGVSMTLTENEYAVLPDAEATELLFSGRNAAKELMDALVGTYFPEDSYTIDLTRSGNTVQIEEHPFKGILTAPTRVLDTSEIDKYSVDDIRIMFHNIWGYTNSYPDASVELLIDIYDTYKPDILGLQECKKLEGVVTWLCENGYSMIRYDKSNGYSNNNGQGNPIFYNPERFRLITSEYRCARNGDKGSTLAVFEERSTGKVFLVTNSHFCANSNAMIDANGDGVKEAHDGFGSKRRDEDARALVAGIESMLERYPQISCVLSGGDFNTTMTKEVVYEGVAYHPYNRLINNGMTNIRDLVNDAYETLVGPYNGAASYNSTWQRFNLKTFVNNDAFGAIDHLFYRWNTAAAPIAVKQYRVLYDRLSCTPSDHLPHFVDFSWR